MCTHQSSNPTKDIRGILPANNGTGAGALDKFANNVANVDSQAVMPAPKILIRKMRHVAGGLTWKRVKSCGNWLPESGDITVLQSESGSFFSGVESCSSVWACPCCASKIMRKRAEEVYNAFEMSRELGWTSGMLTLTIPHHKGQSFSELQKLVSGSFRKLLNRRKYRDLKEEYKVRGMIRSLEITYGENGWHPHLHILIFTESTDGENGQFAFELFQLWKGIILKAGYGECSIKAYDFDAVKSGGNLAEYVQKWDISRELVSNGMGKTAKKGSRNPFEILASITKRIGDVERDKKLFIEYAKGTKGSRQLTWTRGLKDFLCVDEKTDTELAEEKEDGEKLAAISGSIYCEARKKRIDPYLLVWIELFGVEFAAEKLFENGIHAIVIDGDLRTGMEGLKVKVAMKTGKANFGHISEVDRVLAVVEKSNPVEAMRKRLAALEQRKFNKITGEIERVGTEKEIQRFRELVEETKEEVRLKIESVKT